MGLESGNYINDLVDTNPAGTDAKSTLDNHDRLIKAAVKNCFPGHAGAICVAGTNGGAADAYTLTPTRALLAYGTNMVAIFTPNANNTGATTLNISGLGAKSVKSVSGAALSSNELVNGVMYAAMYNGSEFRLLGVTKGYVDGLAFSTALPAQTGNSGKVLSTDGSTASWSADLKAGTIRVVDSTDTTKKIAFACSSVATATTRTVTFGDRDVDLGMGFLHVRDEKASGTDGGSSVAADITQTRALNTVVTNTISGASLAGNVVTLPSGKYRFRARAPHYLGTQHKAFLYNTADSSYTGIGSNAYSISGASVGSTDSVIEGEFTIASSKTFTIRHYTATAVASSGLGAAVTSGQVEVYSEARFWKIG